MCNFIGGLQKFQITSFGENYNRGHMFFTLTRKSNPTLFCFSARIHLNLGNGNPDMDHITWARGPQVPEPWSSADKRRSFK